MFLLGRITALILDAAYCYKCSVVSLLVTIVNPTKTDEPIEVPFGMRLG